MAKRARRSVSAPQALALYPQLTVAENLETFASLAGLKGRAIREAVDRAMAVTQTAERARTLVRQLSRRLPAPGEHRRRDLARPRLLVLDEPTVGVDLSARDAVSEALRRLRDEGVGILLVTHDLDQAGDLADRVGILKDGRKVLEGPPDVLIDEAFGDRMEVELDVGEASPDLAARLAGEGFTRHPASGAWNRLTHNGYVFAADLAERLKADGVAVREVRVRRPSLEHLFAQVVETPTAETSAAAA